MADEFNPFEQTENQAQQIPDPAPQPFGQDVQGEPQVFQQVNDQQYGQQQYGQQPYGGQPYGGQPPYGQQQYGQPAYNGEIPGRGKATAALVLGIVGLILAFLMPFAGLICSIVAVVVSGKARREGYVGGSEKAGRILGIIGIVLSALIIALAIVAGVAIFNSPEFQDQLNSILNS